MMRIEFTEKGWDDLQYWLETDISIVHKIRALLNSITRTPTKGIGKPEPLKHDYKGCWSRRIDKEHRLVYQITGKKNEDQKCIVLQCKYHYDEK